MSDFVKSFLDGQGGDCSISPESWEEDRTGDGASSKDKNDQPVSDQQQLDSMGESQKGDSCSEKPASDESTKDILDILFTAKSCATQDEEEIESLQDSNKEGKGALSEKNDVFSD